MTLARKALYSIMLLLLLLLAALFYSYKKLPAAIEQQAGQYLQRYGVQSLDYGQLEIGPGRLFTQTLAVAGEFEGVEYDATLSSLELHYNWRALLEGELKSISLKGLTVSLREKAREKIAAGSVQPRPSIAKLSTVLPQPYLAALPVEAVAIDRWTVTYLPMNSPPIAASGSLHINKQLRLTLESSYQDSLLQATIVTQGEAGYPRADLRLVAAGTEMATLVAALNPAPADQWQWSLAGTLDYSPLLSWLARLDPAMTPGLQLSAIEGLALEGKIDFTATVNHADELNIEALAGAAPLAQFEAEVSIHTTIEALDYPATVSGLSGDVLLGINLAGEKVRFTLGPTEVTGQLSTDRLALPQKTRAWLGWPPNIPVLWRNPEAIEIVPVEAGGWSLSARNNQLVIGDEQSQLHWHGVNLSTVIELGEELGADTQLSARLRTRLRGEQLPELKAELSQHGSLSGGEFTVAVHDIAQSIRLTLKGDGNLKEGRGSYLATLGSEDLAYLSETLLPLMQRFELIDRAQSPVISSGSIALETRLKSEGFELSDLRQHSRLSIENLSGSFSDYQFSGGALAADWTGIEHWQTPKPVEFSMASLNIGFELLDTRGQLSLPKATPIAHPTVQVDDFVSLVFGGRVFLPEPRQWDFRAQTNTLPLRAEGWQLAEMVALQENQDIQAQGVLEGELPLTLTAGRVIIDEGYLRALPPGGSIRYIANDASRALAAQNPELELALKLLDDFQYDVLSTQVQLDEGGNLLMGLSLAGKNPAEYEGKPVNFNINLEQNLDPLLQSLRLSDKLVEHLEDRIN